jgi:hypothetical protein
MTRIAQVSLLAILLVAAAPMPMRAAEARQRKSKPKPPALIPTPPAGTLLVGPYLLEPRSNGVRIRWEVMGEKETHVALLLPDGTQKKVAGMLLTAEELTITLPGRVYEVELYDLKPCQKYKYWLLPFEDIGSTGHDFQTPPAAGQYCESAFRIMVYGDSRTNHKIHTGLVPAMVEVAPQMLINIGDIVHLARRVYEWHKFFQIEKLLLATAPIAIVPGNHEGYKDLPYGAELMRRYFRGGTSGGTGHYSFDYGPIHFVMLDLFWGVPIADGGREWVEQDLAAVPAGRYIMVVMHAPVYSFGHHVPTEELKSLRAVFKKAGVSAVFAGHSHIYEHFDVEGIHYLTVGGSGAPFHTPKENVVPEEQKFLLKTDRIHHFVTLDVSEDEIEFKAWDSKANKVVEEWRVAAPELDPRPTEK